MLYFELENSKKRSWAHLTEVGKLGQEPQNFESPHAKASLFLWSAACRDTPIAEWKMKELLKPSGLTFSAKWSWSLSNLCPCLIYNTYLGNLNTVILWWPNHLYCAGQCIHSTHTLWTMLLVTHTNHRCYQWSKLPSFFKSGALQRNV